MALLIVAVLLLLGPAVPAQQGFAVGVVHPYGDENSESRAVFSTPIDLPSNVALSPEYAEAVDAMLRSSPTFRAQCTRIAMATELHVTVAKSIMAPPQSAITRLTRQRSGRLDADVEIGPFGDVTMLVAHEFEHIIEQLDGVNLSSMSGRPGTGVRTDPRTGQFETERAIAIGQRVAREAARAVARR